MIARAYLYLNDGMVVAISEDGLLMPEYRGKPEDVRQKILADAPSSAVFRVAEYGKWYHDVPRDVWARLRYDPWPPLNKAMRDQARQEGGPGGTGEDVADILRRVEAGGPLIKPEVTEEKSA